jgi:hypothetical protein
VLRWLCLKVRWRRPPLLCLCADPDVDCDTGAVRPRTEALALVAVVVSLAVELLQMAVTPHRANGLRSARRPAPCPGCGWEAHVARRAL